MSVPVKHWWRVELGADGSRVVTKLDAAPLGEFERGVYYLQAATEEDAILAAVRKFDSARTMARKRRNLELGNCSSCAKPNDSLPMKRCKSCLERNKQHTTNGRLRKLGVTVESAPRIPADPATNETRWRALRLQVLREVSAAWRDSANMAQFADWLRKQVKASEGDQA
jgi:hypothetical protein